MRIYGKPLFLCVRALTETFLHPSFRLVSESARISNYHVIEHYKVYE